MPPDPPSGPAPDGPAAARRRGLADWVWAPLLTAAIVAALILIGRATFVA
jgi:hypothetical protein